MDVITETSLEALIQRATDNRNTGVDKAAVEAFCGLVKKNPESAYVATKLLGSRIQSPDEWEAMQGLSLLDACMRKCGAPFHTEVGKFRFLNEMIKVVSPKFLGARTSPKVRDTVLGLLHAWTVSYPHEHKIREAYDMLKKQGVVLEPAPVSPRPQPAPAKLHVPLDDEFGQQLQKLLSSKNAQDLDAANRLIKVRVLESERRASEVERIKTNVRLLAEMVDSCGADVAAEDLQLMGEVHAECLRLRPTVFKLAAETVDSEMLTHVLSLNEEISQVFEKYASVVAGVGSVVPAESVAPVAAVPSSLLDLTSPVDSRPSVTGTKPSQDLLGEPLQPLEVTAVNSLTSHPSTDLDQLGAIFGALSRPSVGPSAPIRLPSPPPEKSNKQKAFDELDVLGETLLQQCKNDITNNKDSQSRTDATDDEMVDLADTSATLLHLQHSPVSLTPELEVNETSARAPESPAVVVSLVPVKPLTDVSVTLDSIRPSNTPSMKVVEESHGVQTMIHLARDKPRPDVSVYVLTTTSTSNLPLSDYLFQVKVPKECKLKLQTPSATSLPAHNSFLPPLAITQILLVANPTDLPVHLTAMLSFTMDDETITEVGEVARLPTSDSDEP